MTGTLVVVALVLLGCVLASLCLCVRLSEHDHPGVVNAVSVIVSTGISVTAFSASILALIAQAAR